MGLRSFITDLFGHSRPGSDPGVNPATGLPVLSGGVDVAGNPYGVDTHRSDDPSSSGAGASSHDYHQHGGSATSNDWSSSSWSGVSSSWPDHSSSASSSIGGGYDPSRGW